MLESVTIFRRIIVGVVTV
ncbi:hypothetical protein F383_36923 [Gossypium arboreum]|uniref:Uncharacterized protein n=1 Tax=Gossypium arboreum TaxID=29729 RepID=A0A0B0MBZ6_GOSAR|nr:hypothetical protein F383_36923 [Gossypium arboreum]